MCSICIYVYVAYMNMHIVHICMCGIHEYVCAYLFMCKKVRQWMSSIVLNLL